MEFKGAKFITSCASPKNFLVSSDMPIIAVSGRSNVGKSSFINMLANEKRLAKTSATPGRTRLVNYFDFNSFLLADLPGYGFAQTSKEEKKSWGKLLDNYLSHSEYVDHVFALVDIRHKPTEDDLLMINYMYHYSIPFTVVATKADKLAKSRVKPALVEISKVLKIGVDNIIAVSNTDKKGREEVFAKIDNIISSFKIARENNED